MTRIARACLAENLGWGRNGILSSQAGVSGCNRHRRRIHRQDRAHQALIVCALECLLPGHHLVEHRPKSPNIGPRIRLFAAELLRRHVLQESFKAENFLCMLGLSITPATSFKISWLTQSSIRPRHAKSRHTPDGPSLRPAPWRKTIQSKTTLSFFKAGGKESPRGRRRIAGSIRHR